MDEKKNFKRKKDTLSITKIQENIDDINNNVIKQSLKLDDIEEIYKSSEVSENSTKKKRRTEYYKKKKLLKQENLRKK